MADATRTRRVETRNHPFLLNYNPMQAAVDLFEYKLKSETKQVQIVKSVTIS
jgi:hypothetical protein